MTDSATTAADAPSLQGRSLSASLTVRDLEASLHWYHEVAGFAVEQRYERGGRLMAVSLSAGEAKILITRDDGAKGLDRVKGEGFSLMITTTEDVDAIAREIRARGGTLDADPADTPWGARVFRMRDPDGFRLVVSSAR